MRCEVCGREITGAPQRKIIEGAKLTVCYKCAAFGAGDWSDKPAITSIQGKPVITNVQKPKIVAERSPRPNDVESIEQMEFTENYGAQIRKARQRLGLSEKELAMKMQEKDSVIKKLEKEDIVPDTKLLQKIKQYLGLDLIEKPDKQTQKTNILAKPAGTRTLGDMVPMKPSTEDK